MTENLACALEATASREPDRPAIVFEGKTLTFAELNEVAGLAAAALAKKGVEPGDRVALWLGNHPDFAICMYAVWRLGAVVVPVHAMLTETEARHILDDSGARLVVCGEPQYGKLSDSDQIEGRRVSPASLLDGLDRAGGTPSTADVTDEQLALIAYTAGTSGLPKGAMLTHANLRANIDQMRHVPIAIRPDDVVLCILPLFHIFGLNVVLNLAVAVGATLVLHERFDPESSVAAVRDQGATVIAGAPPAYVAWLNSGASASSFDGVRVAISGAAPLPKEVLDDFRDRFGVTIWEGYGLTETSPALTSTAVGGVPKPASVGRPVPDVEIKLVDEEGEQVEDGDPGEIIVRGPNVFKGYWNAPGESAKVLVDGWFHTGDVGVFDDDGDLFIVDRRRDMVIVSGFNVYPREVEDALRRHPNVDDCAVVGAHDAHTGERVRAFVVLDRPGAVTAEDIIEFCRRSLAPYKIPSTVELVTELPRNAAGKVLRRELKP